MDKLDEALEELVVKTANLYGGFEGFEEDDKENMQLSKNKIVAWHKAEVKRIIGEDSFDDDMRCAKKSHSDAGAGYAIGMKFLRIEQRKRAGL